MSDLVCKPARAQGGKSLPSGPHHRRKNGTALRAALLVSTVLAGFSLTDGALAKSSASALALAIPKTTLPQIALPQGGSVAAGSAYLTVSGAALNVNQTSQKAIIDWSSFSIGQGGTVNIANGSGATLNRVLGAGASYIDGHLNATGSVYLINANGVIVGKTGVVNVGGAFVASTLDVSNTAFLAGGPLDFSGASQASVINLGKIGALGGNIALIAAMVDNEGSLTAANGAVGLIAGAKVLLKDQDNDGNGLFSVELGDSATSVTNGGIIAAATAELRAQQGNVYALAGSTGGLISATGVDSTGGRIWLVSEGGTTTVSGTLEAEVV
jgi:filamentous hemagglutinin family protein